MLKLVATWNTARRVWETTQKMSCEHYRSYSQTWQSRGMMQSGKIYELPTSGHRIKDSESSLLPTPAVAHVRNHDEPIENYLQRRQDYTDGKTKGMPGASLGVAVRLAVDGLNVDGTPMQLWPTPAARDYKDGTAPHYRDGIVQTDRVARVVFNSGEVFGRELGKYQAAVDRWVKVTGRDYPDPVSLDGRDGNPRLNVDFVAWMMGLPEDWLNVEGISRKDKMILCGNGVVALQAQLAIKELLEIIEKKAGE